MTTSKQAEINFRARLAELGAELLEPRYLGSERPHRVRCNAGHINTPQPHSLQKGQGICRICAGKDSVTAEANFRTHLTELGAILLEPEYLGSKNPHRVRCIAGHICTPRPNT